MRIEDKKILAEWMGWKSVDVHDLWKDRNHTEYIKETKYGTSQFPLSEFNPDRDYYYFFDVYENLKWDDKIKVFKQLGFEPSYAVYFRIHDWMMLLKNDLPKVIQAVLEVITPQYGG